MVSRTLVGTIPSEYLNQFKTFDISIITNHHENHHQNFRRKLLTINSQQFQGTLSGRMQLKVHHYIPEFFQNPENIQMEIQLKKIVTYMMHKIGKENYRPRKKNNNQKNLNNKVVKQQNLITFTVAQELAIFKGCTSKWHPAFPVATFTSSSVQQLLNNLK